MGNYQLLVNYFYSLSLRYYKSGCDVLSWKLPVTLGLSYAQFNANGQILKFIVFCNYPGPWPLLVYSDAIDANLMFKGRTFVIYHRL